MKSNIEASFHLLQNPPDSVPATDPGAYLRRLSNRQTHVLFLVCKGFRNREIAEQLDLSVRIVKACVGELLLIFDVSNRTELAGMLISESRLFQFENPLAPGIHQTASYEPAPDYAGARLARPLGRCAAK